MRYASYYLAASLFSWLLTITLPTQAAPTSTTAEALALEYPELTVVPRASERLKSEAENEAGNGWYNQRMLLTSSLFSVASGLVGASSLPPNADPEQKATSQTMASTATFVGVSWLIVGTWLAKRYTPYNEGWQSIKGLSQTSQKDQLHRERLAEEALHAPASLGKKIMIIAVVSNLAVNAGVASSSGDEGRQIAIVGAFAALAPVLFPYHWQVIDQQHQLYKKKIYGPVVQNTFVQDKQGHLIPGLGLSWVF